MDPTRISKYFNFDYSCVAIPDETSEQLNTCQHFSTNAPNIKVNSDFCEFCGGTREASAAAQSDIIHAAADSLSYEDNDHHTSTPFTISDLVANGSEIGEEARWANEEEGDDPRYFTKLKNETKKTGLTYLSLFVYFLGVLIHWFRSKDTLVSPEKTKETKESTNTKISNSPKPKEIFKITRFNNPPRQNEINDNMLKKKRGRRPKKGIKIKKNKVRKQPRKYDEDNINRKNQINFINYIMDFLNCLLQEYGIKYRFKKIAYCFKKNSKFEYFELLKRKTLGDILKLKISEKYTNFDENHNLKTHEEIKDLPVIGDLLKENYLTFFQEVYYKSERKISLKKYGSDEILTLHDNIKTYKDKVNNFVDRNYAEVYESTIREFYINTIY